MKATLIISIYKNVRALEAILKSLHRQTEQDFELILSEDGDDPEMAQFIANYSFPWPMQHLTQPDEGWRKNRMLNRSIVAARSEYLIFIDGDCILHPRFIEVHLKLSAPHRIVAGKRVRLNYELSEQYITKGKIHLFPHLFRKQGCQLVEEGFFLHLAWFFRRHVRHLTGSNMSMYREDLLAINGFDENYILPAIGEDFDIEWRLPQNGCTIVSARNLAIQYHLYHPENWVDDTVNMRYFYSIQEKNQIICKNGIKKL